MITMRQYAASPRIKQFVSYHTEYFSASWVDEFYNVVWSVDTAQGFGLDIWGRIVGLEKGRVVTVRPGEYFGFKTATINQSWKPFGQGVFYDGNPGGQSYNLSDAAFRPLILAKAFTNISDLTTFNLNRMLQQIFPGRGRCYVKDVGGMEIQYVFEFTLEPWERGIFNSDAVPSPGGVVPSILEI